MKIWWDGEIRSDQIMLANIKQSGGIPPHPKLYPVSSHVIGYGPATLLGQYEASSLGDL